MECNINSLSGYAIEATDGEIGKVEDFYFDDETWTIRYFVVKTGNWLSGKKVLISTAALTKLDIKMGLFIVNVTQQQVRESPDIDTAKPVSRQQEAMLNQHHIWENYWGSGSYGGEMGIGNNRPIRIKDSDRDPKDDIHLRSVAQVSGYAIHASDGEIGHVNDFIVDDQTWILTDIVVDTHNWIGGKKVLVGVTHVNSISYLSWRVYVDIRIAEIESCKLYKEAEYKQDV
jgi:uncharacterized protein YrrD